MRELEEASHGGLRLSRRQLLEGAGAASLLASGATVLGALPASAAGTTSRVAFVASADRVRGTRTAIELAAPIGLAGRTVFVKPNYNTADPAPASTDTALLEALLAELRNASTGAVTIGDRSGMAVTREAMEAKGVFALAERYGGHAVALDELGADAWRRFPAEGTHWERGFAFARPALEAAVIVTTCCLKTHRYGGHFTLSLKNTVGLVAKHLPGEPYDYMRELHGSSHQRLMIAEANAVYHPALVVLDAVEAFTDGGPDNGTRAQPEIILAGTDRVALDAVGVAILRSLGTTSEVTNGSIWQLEQIRRAVELGLGAAGPDQIEFVTPDAASRSQVDRLRTFLR